MLDLRKDSENFPELATGSKNKAIIDPTKEVEFPKPPVKKEPSPEEKAPESIEKEIIEAPKVEEQKVLEPVIVKNYKQVINAFKEIMKSIKPTDELEKLKELPVIDIQLIPTVETLYPTKQKDIYRGKNRKKKGASKKGGAEVVALTKGRHAK